MTTKPVSMRLSIEERDRIDALRSLFSGPSGRAATRSEVLRGLVIQGTVLPDHVIKLVDAARGELSRAAYIEAAILAARKDQP